MPLTKEQMKIYQRNRRAQQRERGGIEGVKRASTLIKVDAIGSDKCQINHSIEVVADPPLSTIKPVNPLDLLKKDLPVPVLAEPRATDALCEGVSMASEARESTQKNVDSGNPDDSRGGQNYMTSTDEKFYMKKPGYYIFEKEIQLNKDGSPRVCWYCKTRFDTRLSMNKFCCPEHKEAWLVASLRRGE